jgi:hypothetical protein
MCAVRVSNAGWLAAGLAVAGYYARISRAAAALKAEHHRNLERCNFLLVKFTFSLVKLKRLI